MASSSSTAPVSPVPTAPSPPQSHGSPSSNLYLVTFLATLFLLLFVSCAIVLRSYVLRQRYNRRINEAMAAGLFLAPRAQGSRRKRFGVRPRLIDTWIATGGPKWDRITPLSAQPIMVKRRLRDGHVPRLPLPPGASFDPSSPDPAALFDSAALAPQVNGSAPTTPTPLRARMAGLFTRRHHRIPSGDDDEQEGDGIPLVAAPPPPAATADASSPPAGPGAGGISAPATPAGYKIRVEMLQVAVLIAMPSQNRFQRKNARLDRHGHGIEEEVLSSSDEGDDDDDETPPLPELVMGVTRVRARRRVKYAGRDAEALAQKDVGDDDDELEDEAIVLGVEDSEPITGARAPALV
ncbi:hypothetical protein BJ912DRAFT_1040377 [Pholiota molesta]|nr:hypothetical protein BJ912DRAFT_1040377 [Pholiota molesta]